MDLRKTLIILSAVCLAGMMLYLTLFRNRNAHAKAAQAATAAVPAAEEQEAAVKTDCAQYKKALIKSARTIKDGAVWDNTTVPYVVTGEVIIGPAATFTIKPGVVIKFQGKNAGLTVKGRIIARGTKAKPITLTSINDDTAGGDTNCDGAATKPAAGDYGTLDLGRKKTIENCEIKYATSVR